MNAKFIKLLALPLLFAGGMITVSCTDYQSDIDEEARLRELGDRNQKSRSDQIVARLGAVRDSLAGVAVKLNNRIDSLARVTLNDETNHAADIAAVRSELANEVATLNASLNNYKTYVAGIITGINGDIQALDGRLSGQISTINGDITAIQGRLGTAEGNIQTIFGNISTINTQITGINGDITTLYGRIGGHDNAIAVVVGRLDSLINANNGDITIVNGRLNGLDNSIVVTNERIDSANTAYNAQIAQLTSQLGTTSADLTQLRVDLGHTDWRIDSLKSAMATELQTLTNGLGTLRTDLNKLDSRVSALETGLAKANNRIDSLAGVTKKIEEEMIQSFVFVPQYEDGGMAIDGTKQFTVQYHVMPAALAPAIAADMANLKFVGEKLLTRAATTAGLTINAARGNSATGIVELDVTPNDQFEGGNMYAFALEYNNGFCQFRTDYVPAFVVVRPTAIALGVVGVAAGASDVPAGTTVQLVVTFTPATTNVLDVTFESSDENVATVDADGTVHAHNNGTVVITAKTPNGQEAKVTLNITGGTIVVNPSAGVNQEDAQ